MQIDVTLKNYRAFPIDRPAQISLKRKGFTALVGPNSAGKSSLLRFFYEFRPLFQELGSDDSALLNLLSGATRGVSLAGVADPIAVFTAGNEHDLEIEIRVPVPPEPLRRPQPARFALRVARPGGPRGFNVTADLRLRDFEGDRGSLQMRDGVLLAGSKQLQIADVAPLKTAFAQLARALYIGPFRNVINLGAQGSYYDIQVGQAFVATWRALQAGTWRALHRATIDLTNDIKRIFEIQELVIRDSEDQQTLIIYADGESYSISEMGSGLTQFILVLANVLTKTPTYILIDEPETSLHPAPQLDLLTTLGSYASEGVVFSTHSIGLARAAADPVYSVRRRPDRRSEVTLLEWTARLPAFLGELGYSAYQELGGDCVLLVEGPTDVRTMQVLLRKLGKDHKVVILPLRGRNLMGSPDAELELAELRRLCDRAYALIDSEKADPAAALEPRRRAFVEACENTGVECHVLERRATENYWPDRAVQAVKGPKYRGLTPYEKLADLTPNWSKDENWRVAHELTEAELAATDLGAFLEKL
jgi:hypothetical protein